MYQWSTFKLFVPKWKLFCRLTKHISVKILIIELFTNCFDIRLFIWLFIWLCIWLSIWLFIWLFIGYLYGYLYIYLTILRLSRTWHEYSLSLSEIRMLLDCQKMVSIVETLKKHETFIWCLWGSVDIIIWLVAGLV